MGGRLAAAKRYGPERGGLLSISITLLDKGIGAVGRIFDT